MKYVSVLSVIVLFALGCEETKTPASEAQEAKNDALAVLTTNFAEAVKADKAGDAVRRRRVCISLYPAMEAAIAEKSDDKKLNALAGQIRSHCAEIAATKRLMEELVQPRLKMMMSKLLADSVTPTILQRNYKDAKQIAKKKQDPAAKCAQVKVMAEALAGKAKLKKKSKQLAQRALAFCKGPATLASVRFHLREATTALGEESSTDFSEHCAKAVEKLADAADSNKKNELRASSEALCLEAIAVRSAAPTDPGV